MDATELFTRLQPHLPKTIRQRRLAGLNERLRFLRYDPGEYFAPHMDGHYSRPDGSETRFVTLVLRTSVTKRTNSSLRTSFPLTIYNIYYIYTKFQISEQARPVTL